MYGFCYSAKWVHYEMMKKYLHKNQSKPAHSNPTILILTNFYTIFQFSFNIHSTPQSPQNVSSKKNSMILYKIQTVDDNEDWTTVGWFWSLGQMFGTSAVLHAAHRRVFLCLHWVSWIYRACSSQKETRSNKINAFSLLLLFILLLHNYIKW